MLREEYRLRVFDDRVLRRIFETERKPLTEGRKSKITLRRAS
jgi:hypothetical protein